MSFYYYLNDDKTARPCTSQEYGDQRMSMGLNNTKHVGNDMVNGNRVSTVWLGINHAFDESYGPLLFETMVFADDKTGQDIYMDRYSTWDEAVAGHQKAIEWVNGGCVDE